MQCLKLGLLVAVALWICPRCDADGLIQKLPPPGHWSAYRVETTIEVPGDPLVNSSGVLIVKAMESETVEGQPGRWMEFSFTWRRRETGKEPVNHLSITRVLVNENAMKHPLELGKQYIQGMNAKASTKDVNRDDFTYLITICEPGKGSGSGYGVIDDYLRAPLKREVKLAPRQLQISGKPVNCQGFESVENRVDRGAQIKARTVYRQWLSPDTPFGVGALELVFENGERKMVQKIQLTSSGTNAGTRFPPDIQAGDAQKLQPAIPRLELGNQD